MQTITPEGIAQLDAWCELFVDVFGVPPDAPQLLTLAELASVGADLHRSRRLRRVLSAFDQQQFRTAFSIRWDERDLKVVAFEGLEVHVDGADPSVSAQIASGNYERHVVAFLRQHLREGMHVVDAGANIGLYSLLAGRLVGPSGRVWSFEPNSENCRLLLTSAAHNGLRNIDLHPLALGDGRGYTFFTSALGSNGGLLDGTRQFLLDPSCKIVPVARLDDFGIDRVDLLKMDVEGAEGLLVQGARELIARCRPIVTAEFSNEMLTRVSGMSGASFLGFFRSLGYGAWLIDRSSHRLVPVGDIDGFASEFEGTVRIEDLALMPGELSV